MSSEQVIAAVLSEVLADHGEVLSVGAFDEIVDRLSTPAAGGDADAVIARLNASMSNPSMIGENLAAAEMAQQAVTAIRRLQARNAEQAERNARQADLIRSLTRSSVATSARLTALLNGIEGLEKEWRRVTDPYTKGIVGRCADYLKALREKANGEQAAGSAPGEAREASSP